MIHLIFQTKKEHNITTITKKKVINLHLLNIKIQRTIKQTLIMHLFCNTFFPLLTYDAKINRNFLSIK